MIKNRRKILFHSLRARMLIWAFVLIALILAILCTTMWISANAFEQQIHENIHQMLSPFSADIDATLNSAKLYTANLHVDPALLSKESQETLEGLNALDALSADISGNLALYPLIDAVFIYHDGATHFIQNYNRSYTQSCAVASVLSAQLQQPVSNADLFQQGYQVLHANGSLYFYIAANVNSGVAGCWLNADVLLQDILAAGLPGLSCIHFSDIQGNDLSEDIEALHAQTAHEHFTTHAQLSQGPFRITVRWDEATVLKPARQMRLAVIIAIAAACLLFGLYVLFLRTSLVRPLNRLVDRIDMIRSGNLQPIPICKSDGDEIENVYHALNSMTHQIENLKIQMYEQKLVRQETQMQLFQLQIRPHFLLNALNTIVSFARVKDYDMVQKMTMYLATHCRYILYNPWFVTLEEELVYTQNFIDMQSTQHDTRYQYHVQVEDALLDYEIPILGIQIFVENALKHSQSIDRPMEIIVEIDETTFGNAHYLRIVIEDTGNGFHPDALEKLNAPDAVPPEDKERGIGIHNIRQRLKILYDDRAWIRFSNRNRGGAHVEMYLPTDPKGGMHS